MLEPNVRREDLVLQVLKPMNSPVVQFTMESFGGGFDLRVNMRATYEIYKLGKTQPEFNDYGVRVVGDGADQSVVIGQQVVVQSLRVGVAVAYPRQEDQNERSQ